MSDGRGNGSSLLSSFASPNRSLPAGLTFGGNSGFEVGAADVSGPFPFRCRPVGDPPRVKTVSMIGTASIRSTIEQSLTDSPVIDVVSPLDHSKIATPTAGFSVRGTFGRTKSNFEPSATGNDDSPSEWIYPS
jgi:hypothetical protein